MIEKKEECKVVVQNDSSDISDWCVESFGYGTWMKMFGFTGGNRSTYYFETEEMTTMFRLRWL